MSRSGIDDSEAISEGAVLQVDLCIVGSGAAGITTAMQFAGRREQVLVLEGGGLSISGESQSLYQAHQSGLDYFDLSACRLRYFGGTTNHWGGYCRENDPIDYERRPALGLQGWPLSYDDIRPFVERAARVLGLEPHRFRPESEFGKHLDAGHSLLEAVSTQLETKVFLLTDHLRFAEIHLPAIRSAENLRVLKRSNAVHITVDPSARRVTRVRIKGAGGRNFFVEAKMFVLAAHALENARLLLASNDVVPEGLGNAGDHVGRYFMEHPHLVSGLFFPSPRFPMAYSRDRMLRLNMNANLSLTRKAMESHGTLQYYCRFRPIYDFERTAQALRRVYGDLGAGFDMQTFRALSHVSRRPLKTMRYAAYRAGVHEPAPLAFGLDHRIEQAPNPNSRVTLSDERDTLGVPRLTFHWALNEVDYRTFQVGQQVVVDEFTRLGFGRFKAPQLNAELINASVTGHYHHIGTTRMGHSASDSVVDADCKVHGTDNLYVAGSSIFASSGYSGPTMMIMAFSLRLAEHLAHRLDTVS